MSSIDETVDGDANEDRPPGPSGLPVVGNTLKFLRDPLTFHERLGEYDEDVVRFDLLSNTAYLLKHPDYIEQVLVTDEATTFDRGEITQAAFREVVDGGLFVAEGDDWARQRDLVRPAFYRQQLETYDDAIVEITREFVEEWDDGEEIHLSDEMTDLTLSVLAGTLLGVDLDGRGEPFSRAGKAVQSKFDTSSPSAYIPTWIPTPQNRRFKQAVTDVHELIDELMAERRNEPAGDDLLSLLLAASEGAADFGGDDGVGLTEDDIREHLITFLGAGHETTAVALTYALYVLGSNPDIAETVREELATVDGTPSAAEVRELPYLDKVVTETLRLYSPTYAIFREPTEPVEIGGYEIPAGTNITMSQYLVHRDERWYDDPLTFRPERWTDEFRAELPDYAYFPFGGGPRQCIGMRFATMEMKLALATVLPRFDLEPVDDDPFDFQMVFSLQPGGPVPMRVHDR